MLAPAAALAAGRHELELGVEPVLASSWHAVALSRDGLAAVGAVDVSVAVEGVVEAARIR